MVVIVRIVFTPQSSVGYRSCRYMGEASALGGDEMADEGEGVFQLGYDGIFIVLVGQVIAGGDVGTAHADAIECQGEDVATLARSDGKLNIER